LKADVSTEGFGYADKHFGDSFIAQQSLQIRLQASRLHDFQGTGDYTPLIGDGDSGSYLTKIERDYTPGDITGKLH